MPLPRLITLAAAVMLALFFAVPGASAQTVVVLVNGEPITSLDIEQRTKLIFLTSQKKASREDVIKELIDEKVKLREGKKFGVDPGSSDIEQSYAGMAQRMRMSPDQLSKQLESQGVRPETLKARLKVDMVWTSLVRGRFSQSLQVSERDVAATVREKGDEKLEIEAFEYKMLPVVLIVPKGSPPAAFEQRKKEAELLREQVQDCKQARSLSSPNVALRDMVTKTTADIPEVLRGVLDKTQVGRLTPPETTKQGVEMVALCERNPTKIDTPKKKEVRDKMFAEKYEAKSKAYLAECRRAAMIEYR